MQLATIILLSIISSNSAILADKLPPPTNVHLANSTDNSLTLSWNYDYVGIVGFEVAGRLLPHDVIIFNQVNASFNGNQSKHFYTLTNLRSAAPYKFGVAAFNQFLNESSNLSEMVYTLTDPKQPVFNVSTNTTDSSLINVQCGAYPAFYSVEQHFMVVVGWSPEGNFTVHLERCDSGGILHVVLPQRFVRGLEYRFRPEIGLFTEINTLADNVNISRHFPFNDLTTTLAVPMISCDDQSLAINVTADSAILVWKGLPSNDKTIFVRRSHVEVNGHYSTWPGPPPAMLVVGLVPNMNYTVSWNVQSDAPTVYCLASFQTAPPMPPWPVTETRIETHDKGSDNDRFSISVRFVPPANETTLNAASFFLLLLRSEPIVQLNSSHPSIDWCFVSWPSASCGSTCNSCVLSTLASFNKSGSTVRPCSLLWKHEFFALIRATPFTQYTTEIVTFNDNPLNCSAFSGQISAVTAEQPIRQIPKERPQFGQSRPFYFDINFTAPEDPADESGLVRYVEVTIESSRPSLGSDRRCLFRIWSVRSGWTAWSKHYDFQHCLYNSSLSECNRTVMAEPFLPGHQVKVENLTVDPLVELRASLSPGNSRCSSVSTMPSPLGFLTDSPPPSPPENLRQSIVETHSAGLEWAASAVAGSLHYRLNLSSVNGSDPDFVVAKSFLSSEPRFLFKSLLAGNVYWTEVVSIGVGAENGQPAERYSSSSGSFLLKTKPLSNVTWQLTVLPMGNYSFVFRFWSRQISSVGRLNYPGPVFVRYLLLGGEIAFTDHIEGVAEERWNSYEEFPHVYNCSKTIRALPPSSTFNLTAMMADEIVAVVDFSTGDVPKSSPGTSKAGIIVVSVFCALAFCVMSVFAALYIRNRARSHGDAILRLRDIK